jgi:hydroxymethylpyrimidine pyrophosphatase-like HAD family hydrolase
MLRPMPGLIAVDLDGTLLDGRGRVSEANRRAVQRLREAGWTLVPATGRSWREARRTLQSIDHDGVAVTAGGSALSDARSGETIDRMTLEAGLVGELAAALNAEGLVAHLLRDHHVCEHDYRFVGTGALDPATVWWLEQHAVPVHRADTLQQSHALGHDHVLRVGAIDRADRLEPVCRQMRERFGDRATMQAWSAVTAEQATGSVTHLLEIYALDCDKWTMLQRVRASHAQPQPVVAVGDGLNDLIMIREAALGIAMGNADPRVLQHADHVAPHHAEDGFAHAIERLLAGEFALPLAGGRG